MIWEPGYDTLNDNHSLLTAVSDVLPKSACVQTSDDDFVLPTTSGDSIQLELANEFTAEVNFSDVDQVVFEIVEYEGGPVLYSQTVNDSDVFRAENIYFDGNDTPAQEYTVIAKGYSGKQLIKSGRCK